MLKQNWKVRAAPISGNIDNPEGGLDALMQAREKKTEKRDLSLNLVPPGDGLWREGWVEGGGEEGDHLHN